MNKHKNTISYLKGYLENSNFFQLFHTCSELIYLKVFGEVKFNIWLTTMLHQAGNRIQSLKYVTVTYKIIEF